MPNELQKTVKAAKKSAVEYMGAVVEGLKANANMELVKVSEASADLLRFVAANEMDDPLVHKRKNEWKKQQPKNCAHQ
ncbi:hypothetical protein PRIPAC_71149 [Pristionchus pacificus]|uniref:G protein gamma domain-containing protein n=1 Tax=Pristionchus pacificus TaxID=54126 RepID=A0A454XKS2_PRIPA|nr:hypothetical protein PRIPAC_71149 [Pristionchus pacificus]|eukprot:PDM73663.1 hypothetical protein PRIPAC_41019 [Pristionchus pacificus]